MLKDTSKLPQLMLLKATSTWPSVGIIVSLIKTPVSMKYWWKFKWGDTMVLLVVLRESRNVVIDPKIYNMDLDTKTRVF